VVRKADVSTSDIRSVNTVAGLDAWLVVYAAFVEALPKTATGKIRRFKLR